MPIERDCYFCVGDKKQERIDAGNVVCPNCKRELKPIENKTPEWVFKCADKYNQTWTHPEHGDRLINTELLNYILSLDRFHQKKMILENHFCCKYQTVNPKEFCDVCYALRELTIKEDETN